jgi:hypothetical protein
LIFVLTLSGRSIRLCLIPPRAASVPDVSGLSYMVISTKPIFAMYGAKKAWLTGEVTMMGKALNHHQDLAVNDIWVSDGALMAKGQALALSGSIAKDLQGKANAHEISPEGLYLDVTDALRRHPIPPQWATAAWL